MGSYSYFPATCVFTKIAIKIVKAFKACMAISIIVTFTPIPFWNNTNGTIVLKII